MNEKNNGNIPPNYSSNNSGDSPNNKRTFPSSNGAYNIPKTDYSQILNSYQHIAKKERTIQIIAGIFTFLSSFIEIIIFLLVKPLLKYHIPVGVIAQFIAIFVVLLVINAFTFAQLIIIFRWNKNVRKVKQQRQTLAMTNYKMINQISIILFTVISILVLNLVFFRFYKQYPGPTRPIQDRLLVFWRIYNGLRRLTWLLIFSYTIFEMVQLNKWLKRKKAITRIEQKILEELPLLQELADLTENYDDNAPFNYKNNNNWEEFPKKEDETFSERENEKNDDNDDENKTYFQR